MGKSVVTTTNTTQQDTVLNDSKLVGGDNVEVGGTLTKTSTSVGGDYQLGGYRVGDNSSFYLEQMSDNTASVIDQALTAMASNSNNFMSLSAGRNPNASLIDDSVPTLAKAAAESKLIKAEGQAGFLSKNGKIIIAVGAVAVVIGLTGLIMFMNRKK